MRRELQAMTTDDLTQLLWAAEHLGDALLNLADTTREEHARLMANKDLVVAVEAELRRRGA